MAIVFPKIIGHRGAAGQAPENTLAAIQYALDKGVQAIEVDATVSQDGTAMVMHDFNVDRTTNGQGPLILKTQKEIQTLDAGSTFDAQFSGENIPSLSDVLNLISTYDVALNIELKPTLGWEEPTARAVVQTLQATKMNTDRLLVSSMSTLALDVFHNAMPNIELAIIVFAIPENWHERMTQHNCQSLHCYHAFVTPDIVQNLHTKGYRLNVYTVNDIEQAKALYDMGVDAIFTDFPDTMLKAF